MSAEEATVPAHAAAPLLTVRVRYFASLREALGPADTVELAPGTTLGELRDRLAARGDRHAQALGRPRALRCALNQTMAGEGTPIAAADGPLEVAFFPPVTGG
jgi:molybdopterin synthase sulfur carrier subunit